MARPKSGPSDGYLSFLWLWRPASACWADEPPCFPEELLSRPDDELLLFADFELLFLSPDAPDFEPDCEPC